MGKLLQRLQDPSRSGVYRVASDVEVVDAVRGSRLKVYHIALQGSKEALLSRIGKALSFPSWFGGNWDALEDSLKDLHGDGHVLLFRGEAPELDMLLDVLGAAAEFWKGEGRPFFAVFVDPRARLALPELFRQA
jgi:hypothetical protein